MRTFRLHPVVALLAVLLVLPAGTLAAEATRAAAVTVSAGFDRGQVAEDAAAQLFVLGEYALLEHLSVGVGYTYLDGLHPLQVHCLQLSARGYLLGRPLDVFALAAAQLYVDEAGPGAAGTVKAGIEWATPWHLLLGAEGGVMFERGGVGWLVGGFLGVRF